jgi:hypothetical protein
MDIRLVKASVNISLEEENEKFKEEFDSFSGESDDPIGQWVKLAKARGETGDTDKVLLELILSLHRKVDDLTKFVKNEVKDLISLKFDSRITHIGFDYFKIEDKILIPNEKYYARAEFPFFPKREVPIYFRAEDEQLCHIILMHDRDMKDYNSYITARERAIIREMKQKD